jgi:L-asparaginase II
MLGQRIRYLWDLMTALHVVATRGNLVESIHRVSAAVVRADGTGLARTGEPDLVTFWRSAAKPFQALPIVQDGAADHWGLTSEELALACGSHSSEPAHLRVVDGFLAKIGCGETDLACGGHPPLTDAVAKDFTRQRVTPTARWSNCSGKHAGMLALARYRGWPTRGYEQTDHQVQQRILEEVTRWTGIERSRVGIGADGCGVPSFAVPLRAMATAYARFGVSSEAAATRIREAMILHPFMIGGTDRLCTDLITAAGGGLIAKVGAAGVYGVTIISDEVGIALKVEDGDVHSARVALVGILSALARHGGLTTPLDRYCEAVGTKAELPILSTLGERTGTLHAVGELQFLT